MKNLVKLSIVSIMLYVLPSLVSAQDLHSTLVLAYKTNPSLKSARYDLVKVRQDIKLAEAGFYPNISGDLSAGYNRVQALSSYTRSFAIQLQINQNLFSGFQTINNLKAAKARYLAQMQALRNEEQNQLNNAVAAYVNVYAAREIVRLRKSNLEALKEQERAAKVRLDVGEGTKTDYAQAKAAHMRAVSEFEEAVANDMSAEAIFQQVVGVAPSTLYKPTSCVKLPDTFNKATSIAMSHHPAILGADFVLKAAEYNKEVTKGEYYPKVDMGVGIGNLNTTYDNGDLPGSQNGIATSFKFNINVPIYDGGVRSANFKKSELAISQAKEQINVFKNGVLASLKTAWAKLTSSKASVTAYNESVSASKIALDGRIAENKVGQATFLDVLNTRSQLINMQVALIEAKKNLVIASYNVQSALGRMTAKDLGIIK